MGKIRGGNTTLGYTSYKMASIGNTSGGGKGWHLKPGVVPYTLKLDTRHNTTPCNHMDPAKGVTHHTVDSPPSVFYTLAG